ncbi:unnamed protein product [Oncorhynchus mykiss]|uniref:Cytospin-A n=1 Tax=Oncorhynchus mykiss TaxID=8022 RepID=A0A060YB74_ONCMY|nr:unnamed protein product [Oncorhynchus mykiss]
MVAPRTLPVQHCLSTRKKSQPKGKGWTAYCNDRTAGLASIQKNRRRTRTQTHCSGPLEIPKKYAQIKPSIYITFVCYPPSRPQDGFSMLLRCHGGSRRNSLLRWCQSRTQGYKNIEITNFSSSWEDGLSFCAVYHTYLPTHIPYSSLSTGDKSENLDLAFQTGESVGIPATLTVEEMLRPGGPDWQRVLGYVESMFRHFEM